MKKPSSSHHQDELQARREMRMFARLILPGLRS